MMLNEGRLGHASNLPEPDLGWRELAACRGMDPEIFFPERGQDYRSAKAVCLGWDTGEPCLVRAECRAFADAVNEPGVWGGTTQRERRLARLAARRARRFPSAESVA